MNFHTTLLGAAKSLCVIVHGSLWFYDLFIGLFMTILLIFCSVNIKTYALV
jgi:hypothetical protein